MSKISEVPQNKEILKRAINRLIIKSCDMHNIGLFHGKMGLVIFFFHYSSFTKNNLYRQFAEQLVDEIFEDIHNQLPFNLENGYCGVGWGIEYLSQNNFVDGDTNEILEGIDNKIMEWNIKKVTDLSLKCGIEGVFHYILCRLKNTQSICPFNNDFLSDLDTIVEKWYLHCDTELRELFIDFQHWRKNRQLGYNPKSLLRSIVLKNFFTHTQDDVSEWNLGIEEGCAGYGLIHVL